MTIKRIWLDADGEYAAWKWVVIHQVGVESAIWKKHSHKDGANKFSGYLLIEPKEDASQSTATLRKWKCASGPYWGTMTTCENPSLKELRQEPNWQVLQCSNCHQLVLQAWDLE